MEGAMEAEFHDWEVLLHDSDSIIKSTHFGGIEGEFESDSIIKSDYFSLDNQERLAKTVPERSEEEGSVESDNPSWIDPSSENRYGRVNSGELWSDSGSERSDERKLNEFDSKTESGNVEVLLGDEELNGGIKNLESLESPERKISDSDLDLDLELAFKEFDEIQSKSKDLRNLWSDSCGDTDQNGSKVVKLEEEEGKENLEENKNLQVEETKVSEIGDKRKVIWWKVPFEVLKYCMFKASPVWSFSVAAALMGFIILGRKLYKMKRKSQSLHLKVILDEKWDGDLAVWVSRHGSGASNFSIDFSLLMRQNVKSILVLKGHPRWLRLGISKKGSPFMVRAARLNEAFSVVRHVPIVRPALPSAGINPWPAMSMS